MSIVIEKINQAIRNIEEAQKCIAEVFGPEEGYDELQWAINALNTDL